MRLGLIIYNGLDTLTGGYIYDRKLVEHLRKHGDTVDVISLPRRSYGLHLADNFSRRLRDAVRGARWDIILEDELNHPSLFLMNERLRKIRPCRIVSLVHHLRSSEPAYRWQRRLYRAVEARYLASVDGHVCISRDTLRCVQELAGTKVPSIIAYPGKDKLASFSAAEIVAARPEQDGTRTILFLGNVIPRKGLHILIHALSRVSGKWRLEVVGSLSQARGYVHAVFRQAIRLGLVERISFFGVLSDADLAERFRRSHILAVPSLHEGFGIVYLEALGWGVPVIASRSGGAREIVRQEKDGFLVDPKNIPELTRSLQALVNDRSLLARMSMNALERYTHFLTWEQSASNIRQFLESLTMKQKTISQGKSRVNDYACAGSCSK